MARTPNLAAMRRHPTKGVEKLDDEEEIFAYLAAMFVSWAKNCPHHFITVDQVKSLRPGERLKGEIDYMHDGLVFGSTFEASRKGLADQRSTTLWTVQVILSNGADPSTRMLQNQIILQRNRNQRKRARSRHLEPKEGEVFACIDRCVSSWFGLGQEHRIVSNKPYFNGTDVYFEYTWSNAPEREKIVFELSYEAEEGEEPEVEEVVDGGDEGETLQNDGEASPTTTEAALPSKNNDPLL